MDQTVTSNSLETSKQIPDIFRQVAALTRDQKEHLLVLLQEELDGGPYVRNLPELPPDDPGAVRDAWKSEIASRIEDMVSGRVERIDAQGFAARLIQRYESKQVQ